MSQALRKLAGNLNRAKTVCLFTNQIREKIGVRFGCPETQPGGRALKFYSSQRLDLRRIETLKEGTEAVGNRVRVKVVKNKVAAPFRQAEFDVEYGVGISKRGLPARPRRSSTTWSRSRARSSPTARLRLGQGRNNAKQFLAENPELADEIEGKIFAALGIERGARRPPPGGRRASSRPRQAAGRARGGRPPSRSARPPEARARWRRGATGRSRERLRARRSGRSRRRERDAAELAEWLAARGFERERGRGGARPPDRGRRARRRALRPPLRRGQARAARLGPGADPRGAARPRDRAELSRRGAATADSTTSSSSAPRAARARRGRPAQRRRRAAAGARLPDPPRLRLRGRLRGGPRCERRGRVERGSRRTAGRLRSGARSSGRPKTHLSRPETKTSSVSDVSSERFAPRLR